MNQDDAGKGRHPLWVTQEPIGIPQRTWGFAGNRQVAHWHILTVVLGATFLAYARTLSFEFVYDDFSQLVNNPAIHSWQYLPEYFTRNVWAEVYPGVQGNYYRPLFLLWCRLNDTLFANQAGMWHLTTVLAHVVATALVYLLSLRLLGDRITAGTASLIFGLHPAHIESVAWVSAVTEPLMGVFVISAFLCYLRWRERREWAGVWLALALVFYAMGMLEKETAVVLPVIIGAHEWLFGGTAAMVRGRTFARRTWSAVRAALPFLLLTGAYLAARDAALGGFSHVHDPIPWEWVVYTWPALLWFWVKHLVAPVGLGSSYEFPSVEHPGLSNFVLPAAALAALATLLWWGARRSRRIAFASAWIILPLIPLLDIRIFPRNDFAHDRYLYLPSVGFVILVAMALRRIGAHRTKTSTLPPVRALATLALAVALGIGTWTQSFYFENNWVFYRYSYLLAPSNPYAANNYGAILARLGMRDEAIKVLERANEENPGYWSLAYNLGRTLYEAHQPELAEKYFLNAIRSDPGKGDAYSGLGLAQLEAGNPKQAEQTLRAALQINPNGQGYHYELGLALKEQGDLQGALREFHAELASNPAHSKSLRLIRQIQSQEAASSPSRALGP
jgi:protein O-mannosyl-transferase